MSSTWSADLAGMPIALGLPHYGLVYTAFLFELDQLFLDALTFANFMQTVLLFLW